MFFFFFFLSILKGYQWLKERVNSEEGRRQLAKIKELHLLADRLGCTAAQLAIGTTKANDTWAMTVILLQSQKITTMFTETSLLLFGSFSLQYTGVHRS